MKAVPFFRKPFNRVLSAALAVVLSVAVVLPILMFPVSADEAETYFALKGIFTGEQPAPSDIWHFEARDFTGFENVGVNDDDTIYDCGDYGADKLLCAPLANVGYTLNNTAADRSIRFAMMHIITGSKYYGASFRFTAPKAGYYDLASTLKFLGNTQEAVFRYRVLKIDADGNGARVWPAAAGQNWQEIDAQAGNLNPAADLSALQFYLQEGESVRLETFGVASNPADEVTTFNITLGSVAMTTVKKAASAKGFSVAYKAKDYYNTRRTQRMRDKDNETAPRLYMEGGGYVPVTDRWSFDFLDLINGPGAPLPLIPMTVYSAASNFYLSHASSGIRSQFEFDYVTGDLYMRLQNANAGVSTTFTVADTGTAVLKTLKRATDKVQIFKTAPDGAQTVITDWYSDSSTAYSVTSDVSAGDKITFQYYPTAPSSARVMINPEVIISRSTNTSNPIDGSRFAALLERPYEGLNYTGAYEKPADSPWTFDLLDGAEGEPAEHSADSFDYAKGNFLYAVENGNAGYYFAASELTAALAATKEASMKSGTGISLKFTCPAAAYYDVSAAVRKISGPAAVKYRVLREYTEGAAVKTQQVYPEANWETAGQDVPALEIPCGAGDRIKIQVCAVGATAEGEVVKISLASPTVYVSGKTAATKLGYVSLFSPLDFAPYVEDAYDNAYPHMDRRWRYDVVGSGGAVSQAGYVKNTAGTLSFYQRENGAKYQFSDSGLRLILTKDEGAALNFTSPKNGRLDMKFTPSGVPSGVQYRLLLNGAPVEGYGWSALTEQGITVNPEHKNIELSAGDRVGIQFQAAANAAVQLGAPVVALLGGHKSGNTVADTDFYAVNASPYGQESYQGDYKVLESERKDQLWSFYTLPADTFRQVETDYYDSAQGNFLYNKENGAGFHFRPAYGGFWMTLKAQQGKTPVGASLDFKAPAEDLYYIQPDIRVLGEETTTARLYFRVVCGSTTLWPSVDGWFEKDVKGGEHIPVPFIEMSALQGEHIRIEAYATGIRNGGAAGDTLQINLGYPTPVIRLTPVETYVSSDVTAKVYPAVNFNPFKNMTVGEVEYQPLESYWNFEILEKTGDAITVHPADRYNFLSDYIMWKNGFNSKMYLRATTKCRIYYTGEENSHGVSLRFMSPMEADVFISGSPLGNAAYFHKDGAAYFRVIKNRGTAGEKTIWPQTGGWEALTYNDISSKFSGAYESLQIGDKIEYQYYFLGGTVNHHNEVNMGSPAVVVTQDLVTDKELFNSTNDFTPSYPLSPFWKYQYSMDSEKTQYRDFGTYNASWKYWLINTGKDAGGGSHYLGASAADMWIYNKTAEGEKYGAVAYAFTATKDGYFKLADSKISTQAPEGGKVRVTVNDEVVWPKNTPWFAFKKDMSLKLDTFKVKRGDVIRFEATFPDEAVPVWGTNKIRWSPKFTLTVSNPDHKQITDIYYGLDDAMLAFFKGLDSKKQFDLEYLLNRKLSEQEDQFELPPETDGPGYEAELPGDGSAEPEPGEPDEETTSRTDEENQGRRRKKVITTYIMPGLPVWGVILIVAGGLLAAGGAATFLILRKKRKTQDPAPESGGE